MSRKSAERPRPWSQLRPVMAKTSEDQPAEDDRQDEAHRQEEGRVHLHRVAGHLQPFAGSLSSVACGREARGDLPDAVEERQDDALVEALGELDLLQASSALRGR